MLSVNMQYAAKSYHALCYVCLLQRIYVTQRQEIYLFDKRLFLQYIVYNMDNPVAGEMIQFDYLCSAVTGVESYPSTQGTNSYLYIQYINITCDLLNI